MLIFIRNIFSFIDKITDGEYTIGHTSNSSYKIVSDEDTIIMKKVENINDNSDIIKLIKENEKFLLVINNHFITKKRMNVTLNTHKSNESYWIIDGRPENARIIQNKYCLDWGIYEDGEYNITLSECNDKYSQKWKFELVTPGIESQIELLKKRDILLDARENSDKKKLIIKKLRQLEDYDTANRGIIQIPH